MFKELLNFDEVCFKGAVVEKERRVCPWGQVFQLSWLPGEDTDRLKGSNTLIVASSESMLGSNWLLRLSESKMSLWINNTKRLLSLHSAGSGHLFERSACVCNESLIYLHPYKVSWPRMLVGSDPEKSTQ